MKEKNRSKVSKVTMQFIHYYLQNTMDITNYFWPSEEDKFHGRALNSTTRRASEASILSAAEKWIFYEKEIILLFPRRKEYFTREEVARKKKKASVVREN